MPLVSSGVVEPQLRLAWSVEASLATVWEHLTTPSNLGRWLGEVVTGEVSPGGSFTIDHGEGYRCESTVLEYAPRRRLRYSWKFSDEPRTEVRWALSHEDGTTFIHLTHIGLGDMVTSYRDGWTTHVMFLEAAVLGTPLPATFFWQIHATIERLNDTR